MDRRTKEQIVSELQVKLKEANLGVLTSFSKMNVEKMEALRNVLRKSNAELKVVKNTLLDIAAKETAFSVLADHFKWPIAIVLSYKDPVEPTKALIDFAKKNPELEIKIGVLDGKILNKSDLTSFGGVTQQRGSTWKIGFCHGSGTDITGNSVKRRTEKFCSSAQCLL